MDGLLFRSLAHELDVRIICPDRPGLGFSTLSPHQTLLNYPDSIAQLAQSLGLKSYRILGCASGGPFALVCAKVLPKEQLIRVGVMAGMGPEKNSPDSKPLSTGTALDLLETFPDLTPKNLDPIFVLNAQDPSPGVLQRHVRDQIDSLPEYEKKSMDDLLAAAPGAVEIITEDQRELYRQGSNGILRDTFIIRAPWGFELEDVEAKVTLWYGTADTTVPIRIGRKMAKKLKRAELKKLAGETHSSIFPHCGEAILRDLLKD